MMVDDLAALGISEEDLADFFAAFDALNDPALLEKIEALTDAEFAAITATVGTAVTPSLEGLTECVLPLLAVSLEAATDPALQGDPALIEAAIMESEAAQEAIPCATDLLNELGRLIIAGLQANGLLEPAT